MTETDATEAEGLAGLQVLVAVAHCDGEISDLEREELADAIRDDRIEATVDEVIAGARDLDAALAAVVSDAARERIYLAAETMSLVDGRRADEEGSVLSRVRRAWNIGPEQLAEAQRLAALAAVKVPSAGIAPQPLEAARKGAIGYTRLNALISAAWGAVPVPLVGEVVQLIVQNRLMDQILRIYGKELDARERAAVTGAAAGLGFARLGLGTVMKLVPGWGSLVGLAAGYVSTWAFGTALWRSIEADTLDAKGFKAAFKAARAEAKAEYEANQDAIAADAKACEAEARALAPKVADRSVGPDALARSLA